MPGGSRRSGESFVRGIDGWQGQVVVGDNVERQSPRRERAVGSARGDGRWAECVRIVPRGRRIPGQRHKVGRCEWTEVERDKPYRHGPTGPRQANQAARVARVGASGLWNCGQSMDVRGGAVRLGQHGQPKVVLLTERLGAARSE